MLCDCYYPQSVGPQQTVIPEGTATKVWKYSLPVLLISSIALSVTLLLMTYPNASTYFYAVSIPFVIISLIAFVVSSVKRCQAPAGQSV
jgi:hypothetical protein